MTAIILLLQLAAGENSLLDVDDDDVVAAVNVRGEIGLQLAAQQVGGDDGGTARACPLRPGRTTCAERPLF